MRILLLTLLLAGLVQTGSAQSALTMNPQVGLIGVRTSKTPRAAVNTNHKLGWMVGTDFRLGQRGYIQPGVFLTGSKTVYSTEDTLFLDEEEVARTSLRLKAMAGYKLVHKENFALRLAVGPTYDFLVSINDDDNRAITDDNLRNGTFNLDATLGMDISIFTLDFGYSYGFTSVYQDGSGFNANAKYQGIYATLGLAFGLIDPN
jgi:hypothetical protein